MIIILIIKKIHLNNSNDNKDFISRGHSVEMSIFHEGLKQKKTIYTQKPEKQMYICIQIDWNLVTGTSRKQSITLSHYVT